MIIWHYTVGPERLNGILNDGYIAPATKYVPKNERPIFWFTTEQFWEPTVTKGLYQNGKIINLGMDDLLRRGELLSRIGIDANDAPYRWSELRVSSGMSVEVATGLARSARRLGGNPSRWRGTFEPVLSSKWRTIEFFNGQDWVTFEAAIERACVHRCDTSPT